MLFYTNKGLYKGILMQDQNALNFLYKKFFPKIKRMIIGEGGDYHTANDIFQEAVITVFRKVKSGEIDETIHIQQYINRICKNIWLKFCIKQGKHQPISDQIDEGNDDILNEYRHSKRMKLYYEHFMRLQQECKQILMAFFMGKSNAQIANELCIESEEYIYKKKFLCKEYLVRSIKNDPQFSKLIGEYDEDILEID